MSSYFEVNHRYCDQLFEMSHRNCVSDIIGESSRFYFVYGEESPGLCPYFVK